eukprot:m.260105 g.260105  ORF g.260105 m.260105 type:complete len:330 (+) comp19675_c1_seq2:410-1399(+)
MLTSAASMSSGGLLSGTSPRMLEPSGVFNSGDDVEAISDNRGVAHGMEDLRRSSKESSMAESNELGENRGSAAPELRRPISISCGRAGKGDAPPSKASSPLSLPYPSCAAMLACVSAACGGEPEGGGLDARMRSRAAFHTFSAREPRSADDRNTPASACWRPRCRLDRCAAVSNTPLRKGALSTSRRLPSPSCASRGKIVSTGNMSGASSSATTPSILRRREYFGECPAGEPGLLCGVCCASIGDSMHPCTQCNAHTISIAETIFTPIEFLLLHVPCTTVVIVALKVENELYTGKWSIVVVHDCRLLLPFCSGKLAVCHVCSRCRCMWT